MENFSLAGVIRRYWLLIITIVALSLWASLAAFGGGSSQKVTGSAAVTVSAERVYPTDGRVYLEPSVPADLQLGAAVSQAWLADPATVTEILSKANVATSRSLKGAAQAFKVVIAASGSPVYQVQFTGVNHEEVTATFASLRTVLDTKATAYNTESSALKLRITVAEPFVSAQGTSLPLMPLAGLISGFVFALLIAVLLERRSAE
jgi:hypothetical protein